MVAINILPQAGDLREWERYWRSLGGGDVLFAEDASREATAAFNIRAAGTKVIVDRKGRIVFRDVGITPYEQLQSIIERAL